VFADQNTFGSSRWPFPLAAPAAIDYASERFPGTYRGLDRVLVLPFNEAFREEHVDFVAASLRTALEGS
jgi:dTDP-4-amino-4,6-dideoxygalactose transaminase